jgi:hypothetical protein
MRERGNEAPMIIGHRQIVRLIDQTVKLMQKWRRKRT